MAQTYAPQIRLTPPAGAVLTYNIASYSYVTAIQPAWEELVTEMEMLDRSIQQTRYGWRVSVAMAGEEMRTEVSAKFRRDGVQAELAAAGLEMRSWWTDQEGRFGLSLSVPAALRATKLIGR
jgi:uncharacterized SAM-dependent methyltransferase